MRFLIMNDEPTIPNQQKRVRFRKKIIIILEGRAPVPKDKEKFGEEPYLPVGLFEYVQNICSKYKEMFEKDGLLIIKKLEMTDVEE